MIGQALLRRRACPDPSPTMRDERNEVPRLIEGSAENITPDFDPVETLTRLLMGGTLEGIDHFLRRLERWEKEINDGTQVAGGTDSESTFEQLRYLAIGSVFLGQQRVRRRFRQARRLVRTARSVAQPVTSRLTDNWYTGVGQILLEPRIGRLILEGRLQEQNARLLARKILGGTIDDIVVHLQDNVEVDVLVNSQVTQLEKNPHVSALAEDIVGHFAENPEQVSKLVTGQSTGLTRELTEEVRERAVTLDMLAESLARRILRRTRREHPPEPPETVQQRARSLHPDDILP